MFQVLRIIIVVILAFAGLIIAVDDFFVVFPWLPSPIRELNAIELAVIPVALFLYALFQRKTAKDLKKEQLNKGMQIGSALCQRLNLTVQAKKLILTWVDTARISTEEMPLWCGSEEAAADFNSDCDHALKIKTEISPSLSTKLAFSAMFAFIARHTANLQTHMGSKKTFVVVPAIEDQAQILTSRFFEIPPALLLLFWDDSLLDQMHTVRSVQSYRYIALKILCRQILMNAGEAPSWSEFSTTPVYAVRDIPATIESGGIDWWNPKWNFDPRKKLSDDEIKEKQLELLKEISSVLDATQNDNRFECFKIVDGRDFHSHLTYVNKNISIISYAKWF